MDSSNVLFAAAVLGGFYLMTQKLKDIPKVLDEDPVGTPPRVIYVPFGNIFSRLGALTLNGLSDLTKGIERVGNNQYGIPMFDMIFKNGTRSRVYGDETGPFILNPSGMNGPPPTDTAKDKYSIGEARGEYKKSDFF